MAKARKATATVVKWKKKKWFSIVAPGFLNKQQLGETLADDDSKVMSRMTKVNLMSLTKDIKKQGVNVTFKVSKIQGDTAFTSIVKYEIAPASVRRMVRKNANKIDPSFACFTADNQRIRIKLLALTRNSVNSSVLQSLHKALVHNATIAIKKLSIEQLFVEIINSRFQRKLASELKKIYPLRFCEVRSLSFEPTKSKRVTLEVSEEDLKNAEEQEKANREAKEAARKAKEPVTEAKPEEPVAKAKEEIVEAKEKEDVASSN